MVSNAIENQVVAFTAFGEILFRVIDGGIGADGSDHVHIPGAAHARYFRAKCLGDLHGQRTNTSCRTVHKDFLPRLDLAFVAKTLQGRESRHGHGSRLLECDVPRLFDQNRFGNARILGESALTDPDFDARTMRVDNTGAEHVVAWTELGD